MDEGISKTRVESGPVSKKAEVVKYIEVQIQEAKKKRDSFKLEMDRANNPASQRPLPSMPNSDGGGDISDWKLAVGERRQEDIERYYYDSPEAEERLLRLDDTVHDLVTDLEEVQAGDEKLIESYYKQIK